MSRTKRPRHEEAKRMVSYPDYTDHAARDSDWVAQSRRTQEDRTKKSHGGPKERFPTKLMTMLQLVDNPEHASLVRFQPHGRAFKVYDKKLFVEQVMPHYFQRQSDYASFIRQLNQYGFLRMTATGPDEGAYYHELFLRGRMDLCELMPRLKDGSRGSNRGTYDARTEPKFCRLPALPPWGTTTPMPHSAPGAPTPPAVATSRRVPPEPDTARLPPLSLVPDLLDHSAPQSESVTSTEIDNSESGPQPSETDGRGSVSFTQGQHLLGDNVVGSSLVRHLHFSYINTGGLSIMASHDTDAIASMPTAPTRPRSGSTSPLHGDEPLQGQNRQCKANLDEDESRCFDGTLQKRHSRSTTFMYEPTECHTLRQQRVNEGASCAPHSLDFDDEKRHGATNWYPRLDPSIVAIIAQMEPESLEELQLQETLYESNVLMAAARDLSSDGKLE